jgi:hypothetical protein
MVLQIGGEIARPHEEEEERAIQIGTDVLSG